MPDATPHATAERLVDSARLMLDEQGLEGLTLRGIARRAKVSHGAPLRHFASLASLLAAVAAEGFRDLIAAVDAHTGALAADARAIDRLAAAGRGYVHFAIANPGVFTIMFRPERLDTTDPVFGAVAYESFQQLQDIVAEAQLEGFHPNVERQPARVRDVDDRARSGGSLDPGRRSPGRGRDVRSRRVHRALALDGARPPGRLRGSRTNR